MARRKRKVPPAAAAAAPGRRQPRLAALSVIPDLTVTWSFSLLDLDGRWSFADLGPSAVRRVLTVLGGLGKQNLSNWNKEHHHPVSIDQLIPAAKGILTRRQLDDLPELFSIRVTARHRLYGIRDGAVVFFLWSDPNHEICPAPKKHT